MPSAYAELHCLSNFTFLRGASHPEELVARAAELGYAGLAITDECSLAGVVRAHLAARRYDLPLLVGSELQLRDGPRLVLLAANREGYGNLSQLITRARRRAPKGEYRLTRADLADGMPGCLALLIPNADIDGDQACWVAGKFPGSAWLAVELHRGGDDARRLEQLNALGEQAGLPRTAAGDVHMHRRSRRPVQDLLTAIRLGMPLGEAGHALYPNAERHLRPPARLARIYPAGLLRETLMVAKRCRFSLDELRYNYPDDMVPSGESASACLRRLTEQGLRERWPGGVPDRVRRLVEHELALIGELHYEPYFLTVHDIVCFARSRGILCQGRGSAANSAVCYALGITSVDPSRMEMLFERFVSRERNEPPDIDVDFEHERREEVIQYLYRRYGRERAALAATVITFRRRSAVRDVGKALGLDLEQVERLAGNLAWWDDEQAMPERLRATGFDPDNPVIRRLTALVERIIGFPRHLSQHVGGMVITRDTLSRLVPVENAAMPERTVIQWDKDDLDAMGLLKVDCLALGMLSAIRRTFGLLARHRRRHLTLDSIPAEDPATYAMIGRADTVGVFQIESRAQMAMLPRLRPRTFYDLVIEVAIIRPGPIQGGMVHPYLRRRQGLEPVAYPSEDVRHILERTLGVPIFQEQVIKLAMVAAGFSGGEADRLRRAIGAWRRRGDLHLFRQRLMDGMLARGYSGEFARRIFEQIQGFGEYGFPESHAASFALLAYVSAWLKCHEPAAFACALLNSQPMGFYAPAQLVRDARRHGVEVRPVDVQASDWDCTLEPGAEGRPAMRLGLRLVKGLRQGAARSLMEARGTAPFLGAEDLCRRTGLSTRDREALAAAGALASLAGDRHRAHWQILAAGKRAPLFMDIAVKDRPAPALPVPSEGEDVAADYASLGLSLLSHPLALIRNELIKKNFISAKQVARLRDGSPVRTAGLVVTRQRPGSASGVVFVTLEDESGVVNVIVWSRLVERQRRELLGSRLLGVIGRVQRQGRVVHVIAAQLEDHSRLLGGLVARSRDFH